MGVVIRLAVHMSDIRGAGRFETWVGEHVIARIPRAGDANR